MSAVSLDITKGVAHIHMDDGKANAINGALLQGLNDALEAAEKDNAAVVLSGRPGCFCGGLDLKTLPALEPSELMNVLGLFGDVMLRLFLFPRPVVAACTGHAIAGGMVVLLGCDERVASEGSFKLGLNETRIGLSLPSFVVEMARCQLPATSLRPVVIQGELYDPERAVELGLVDTIGDPATAIERATARATELADLPHHSYAANKRAIRSPGAELGREAYHGELEQFSGAFGKM